MRALDLYVRLAEQGIAVMVVGDRLQVSPASWVSAEDMQELREAKSDLLAIVGCVPATATAGTMAAESCYRTVWELARLYGVDRIGLSDDATDEDLLRAAHVLAGRIAEQRALGHFPGGRRMQRDVV